MAYNAQTLSRAIKNAPKDSVLRGEGKRIDNEGAFALIALAFMFDLMQTPQLIPVIGIIFVPFSIPITITAYIFIFVAIKTFFKNIPILGGAQAMMRMGSVFASLVVEFIPFLSAIPAITPGVIALIVSVRLEDMGKGRMLPRATDLLTKKRRRLFEARQERALIEARNDIDSELTVAEFSKKKKRSPGGSREEERSGQNPDDEFRRGARAFDIQERYAGNTEGQEQKKETFQRGDRVRFTAEKIRKLRRSGDIASFPSTSGTVMNLFPGGYTVQFGRSKHDVLKEDVERA
jgi:hypothetical protein